MTKPNIFSWEKIHRDCDTLSAQLKNKKFVGILSVTRGGMIPACLVAQELGIKRIETIGYTSYQDQNDTGVLSQIKAPYDVDKKGLGWLVVDDLCDSGRTFGEIRKVFINAMYATLYVKPTGKIETDYFVEEHPQDTWIYFPWELKSGFLEKEYVTYD